MPRSFLKTVKTASKKAQRYAPSPHEDFEANPAVPTGVAVAAEPRTGSAFTPVTPKKKGMFINLLNSVSFSCKFCWQPV